ncbi:MAG: hypothetical protein A3C06_03145 [Candidatus Taylorbacteria bacterium RIFCSPHIGHO2_02_FULL_46_13]|uniref:Transposase IS200-like domain-containing protein n=1 Tax=Candidatus Taylorbacteria bacterium RIFCSPHIGHO2_02_FULL_46_13 TaxID=1802312 RepID=A0A1G2MRP2_9BACT|nr:MAG: hypothetical protein A3C06_03145 [Candidatus Taylorbacteria bacterium RIFCSPHIGHO2_02_FULL_46_13]
MTRNFQFGTGEYYHLYNRGTDKRETFLNDHDRTRFIMLLYLCNTENALDIRELFISGISVTDIFNVNRGKLLVKIGAYCLMPNHFHLLVQEFSDKGLGISKFMQKLNTAYTMYFNKKYDRTGALFQGRFKAKHAHTDEYLKYLFAYIHLNPVKLIEPNWKESGIQKMRKANSFLDGYRFSSYKEYTGESRPEKTILARETFPTYFPNTCDFDSFIRLYLEFSNEG